ILDVASGQIEFSVAGHNMPYRFSAEGARPINGDTGPVLGILERAEFPTVKTALLPGEGLLLYTDGVTEALNAAEEECSPERLAETVSRLTHLPARHLVGEIVQSVQQHSAGMKQTDDLTALVIRYLGQSLETSVVPFSEVSQPGLRSASGAPPSDLH